jgi:hypothetical protein
MGGIECLRRLVDLDPAARVVISSGYADATQPGDPCAIPGAAVTLEKPTASPTSAKRSTGSPGAPPPPR